MAVTKGPITIDFEPMPSIVAQSFNLAAAQIDDFRTPLRRAIKQVVIPSIVKNFDQEGRPSWEPLAKFTIERRLADGYAEGPILDRSGALRKIATSIQMWSIKKADATVRAFPPSAWYGNVIHEGAGTSAAALAAKKGLPGGGEGLGTSKLFPVKRGDVVIPARPFMVIQTEDLDPIENVFVDWIREVLVTSGFRPGLG